MTERNPKQTEIEPIPGSNEKRKENDDLQPEDTKEKRDRYDRDQKNRFSKN